MIKTHPTSSFAFKTKRAAQAFARTIGGRGAYLGRGIEIRCPGTAVFVARTVKRARPPAGYPYAVSVACHRPRTGR